MTSNIILLALTVFFALSAATMWHTRRHERRRRVAFRLLGLMAPNRKPGQPCIVCHVFHCQTVALDPDCCPTPNQYRVCESCGTEYEFTLSPGAKGPTLNKFRLTREPWRDIYNNPIHGPANVRAYDDLH